MTMMRRSEDSRRFWKTAFGAAVLFFVCFFAFGFSGMLRSMAANLFAPRSTNAEFSALSKDALVARVEADEQTLSEIKYQAALYGLLSQENTNLRSLLNAAPSPSAVTARVIARPPQTAYDTLLIDRGALSGIAPGDEAVFEGIALGKVITADPETSLIQLFSSPGTEADALVGVPPALSVARGEGGGSFSLAVPNGVAIAPGDLIRAEGSASLLLGIVGGVSVAPTGSTQNVIFHAPVSFSALDFVSIIR